MVVDTGAPFSVLPYRVCARRPGTRTPSGPHLRPMVGGLPGPEAADELTWLGVRCVMGQLRTSLVDEDGYRSRRLTLAAKLPIAPVRPPLERLIILGQHFFAFNRLTPGAARPVVPTVVERW